MNQSTPTSKERLVTLLALGFGGFRGKDVLFFFSHPFFLKTKGFKGFERLGLGGLFSPSFLFFFLIQLWSFILH